MVSPSLRHFIAVGGRLRATFSVFGRIEMPTGKIKKVIPEKGFGFISGGKDDLFFHHSELKGVSIEELREGQAVSYEIGSGKKGPCAVSVQLDE
jgi:cold shock protein